MGEPNALLNLGPRCPWKSPAKTEQPQPLPENLLFCHLFFMNFHELPKTRFSHTKSQLRQQEDKENAHPPHLPFPFITKLMRSICKGHRQSSPRCTPCFLLLLSCPQVSSITKDWLCGKKHPPRPKLQVFKNYSSIKLKTFLATL